MVLVFGSESSGTRLVKEILLMNGYVGGKDNHELWGNQPGEYHVPPAKNKEHRVWRHSFPMGPSWPDIYEIDRQVEQAGHTSILVLVTNRATWPCLQSIQRRHGGTLGELLAAYRRIYSTLLPTWPISYEELIQRGADAFRGAPLELSIKKVPELRDENTKWYK